MRVGRLDVRARESYVCRLVSSTALPGEGGPLAAGGGTVAGFLAAWLAHVRGRVRRVTFEGYEVLVRRHALPALGALELAALRPLHLLFTSPRLSAMLRCAECGRTADEKVQGWRAFLAQDPRRPTSHPKRGWRPPVREEVVERRRAATRLEAHRSE